MKKILYGTAVIFLALFVLTACGPKTQAPKAGPSPDNLLVMFPVDAQGVFYVDIHKAMGTEMAKKAIADAAKKEDFQKFIAASGIDIEKDVNAVAIAMTEKAEGKGTEGVALINLKYNKDQILNLIKAKAQEEGQSLIEEDYNGIKMYNMQEKKGEGYFVFYDDANIIAGNDVPVKACIDVAQKKKDNVFKNVELTSLLKETNKNAMFWGAVLLPPEAMEKAASNPMMSNLKDIKSLALFFDYKNTDLLAEIKVIGSDSTKNKQIAEFLTGIKSFGAMAAAKEPEIGELLNKIEITAGDNFVKVSATVPESVINTLVEKEKAKEKQQQQEQTQPEKH